MIDAIHPLPADMLLWIAVGDAYGACFEYSDAGPGRPNDLSGYPPNLAYPAIGGGRYTDDAQMTAALAEALLDGPLTRDSVALAFVRRYRSDPRPGYSRGMQALMSSCRDGDDLLGRIRPVKDTSGAAMRVLPVAALPDPPSVMEAATLQARVTHDTPGGRLSACAAAMMAFGSRTGIAAADLPDFVAVHVHGEWTRPWSGARGIRGGGRREGRAVDGRRGWRIHGGRVGTLHRADGGRGHRGPRSRSGRWPATPAASPRHSPGIGDGTGRRPLGPCLPLGIG